jgi:hypothetical protein
MNKCINCRYFCSYHDLYEDELEDDDCGICEKTDRHKNHDDICDIEEV